MDGGRDEDRPHKQRSMDVGREQAVCCSFVLSVVPASSSTLSLANPAVENHSKMSINQELLPDEASLADGSPARILTLAGNPLWGWQTLVVSTTLFSHGQHPDIALPAVPATSPALSTNTERSRRRCAAQHWCCMAVHLPCTSILHPCGQFFSEYGRRTEFQYPTSEWVHVCESTKVLRVGRKIYSLQKLI